MYASLKKIGERLTSLSVSFGLGNIMTRCKEQMLLNRGDATYTGKKQREACGDI